MKILFSLLILFSCSAIKPRPTADERRAETERINLFFEKAFTESLKLFPEGMTHLGMKEGKHLLNDISDERALIELEMAKRYLAGLKEFNFERLEPEAQLSYRIFEEQQQDFIQGFEFRFHSYPVNQMFGRHSSLPGFMINIHLVEELADAEAYISRLNQFKSNLTVLVEKLETRRQKNILAPKFVYPKVIKDCQNVISGRPFTARGTSPLYADFAAKLSKLNLPRDQRLRLMREMETALIQSVGPGYRQLIEKLRQLEKEAPMEAAATTLPDGERFYKWQLRQMTTTELGAEEIHQMGLRETERIHAEMKAILKDLGFKGELQEFFTHLRTSWEFRYHDTRHGRQQYLQDTQKIIDTMKAFLPQMFGRLPKAELVVRPVEAYREASAPQAFYQGPSEDGHRPGIYYVNLHDMATVRRFEQEALAYHEALPGHHLQIAIAKELENLPSFRRHGGYTAFSEGWGLYAEYFPKEFGFYQDPYSNFGRLTMELWRAGRLVVDTGIHHKKWSMQQAARWLDENTHKPTHENLSDVQRYVVMPAQATAYMVGMLKILELRSQARQALGERFKLSDFHDQVLGSGGLPLKILEEKIEAWIRETKN
jgi:uncharacterized protein (DUF885 family)